MTARRRVADLGIRLLHLAARAPGRRFYRLFLDEVNRRHNDAADGLVVTIGGRDVTFTSPNQLVRWRVETLFSKEPATLTWIDSFAADDVFWDVGANIGLYSVYAAAARGCRVLAIEPVPANFALLAANVGRNDLANLVSPLALALADRNHIGTLAIDDPMAGAAFARFASADESSLSAVAALGVTIDDLVARFRSPFPNHIKIDVDGNEAEILRGAAAILSDPRLQSILIELDDNDPAGSRTIETTLETHGFAAVSSERSPLFPDSPARNVQFRRFP